MSFLKLAAACALGLVMTACDSNESGSTALEASAESMPLLGTYEMHRSDCDLPYELKVQTGEFGGYVASLRPKPSESSTCEPSLLTRRYGLVLYSMPQADGCGSESASFGSIIYDDEQLLKTESGDPVVVEGRITDNRGNHCELPLPGLIVVELTDEHGNVQKLFSPR